MPAFQFYDRTGRAFGLSERAVSRLVRQHAVSRCKIYGRMAVDVYAWDDLMARLSIPLAPGYEPRSPEASPHA